MVNLSTTASFLERHLKKLSVTILTPTEIPSGGQDSYSPTDVRNPEDDYREEFTKRSTLASYVRRLDVQPHTDQPVTRHGMSRLQWIIEPDLLTIWFYRKHCGRSCESPHAHDYLLNTTTHCFYEILPSDRIPVNNGVEDSGQNDHEVLGLEGGRRGCTVIECSLKLLGHAALIPTKN